jgi:hypothetical protein
MGGADIEKPLLEHNQLNPVFPNCPGCKNAYLQSPDAGIPYKQFITVFLLVLCSSLPISSLYPFLYFMVQDFHIAKSDKDLGFFVGAIGKVIEASLEGVLPNPLELLNSQASHFALLLQTLHFVYDMK